MGQILILTEKSSVAATIAKVLNANNKHEGYYSGNGYIITHAKGHLFQLYDAKDYNLIYQIWDINNYPVIPDEFKYKLIDDPGIKKQFKIIQELAKRPDVELIINAADSDREGELLATEIIAALKTTKPVKRLWVSSHTPEDIKSGIQNLKSETEMKPLQDAGYCRQWIDWLIGINYTVATTKFYGQGQILKVGRVILPTLKLLYDREIAIKNFKPEPYFELQTVFKSGNEYYTGLYFAQNTTKHPDQKILMSIQNSIQNQKGKVIKKEVRQITEQAPRLFNLTDLQGYIIDNYQGFTAAKVLKITQSLYEKQFVTYPRTASRHLDDTQKKSVEKVLNQVKSFFIDQPVQFKDTKGIFDSSKVDSHPAIIPTYIIPSENDLNPDEKIVYMAIVKRFVAKFLPAAKYDEIEMVTDVSGYQFITKGKSLVEEGWRAIYPKESNSNEMYVKNIKENSIVDIARSEVFSKKTTPPKRYTEASLLAAMENISRYTQDDNEEEITEDDIKQVLKGYSLGTSATRAEILEKIKRLGYVQLKGKSFYITKIGTNLVEVFPLREYLNPKYTGHMELKLKEIETGKYSKDEMLQEIKMAIREGIARMKTITGKISNIAEEKQTVGLCPDCGKEIIENSKAYGCSGYKEGCKFTIWKENPFLKKFNILKIPVKLIKDLLKNPDRLATMELNNKLVTVSLIKNEKGYWNLNFDLNNKQDIIVGQCPECGQNVIEFDKGYRCKGCKFVLWKEDKWLYGFYKKNITKSMAKSFLSKGSADVKGLWSELKKDKFDATVYYRKNEQGYWSFSFK